MMEFFMVGGAVRDEIMGLPSKDIDFTVVLGPEEAGPDPFIMMHSMLISRGFKIFQSKPEFFTIRAMPPMGFIDVDGFNGRRISADFVLARKDGTMTDGRRPDFVEPGTLLSDLSRRDFTMNAIAKDADGNLIDPFNGQSAIRNHVITCVGSARDRLNEDPLRALRALRFSVTKQFRIDPDITKAISTMVFAESLRTVSKERQREEMEKMFAFSTIRSIELISKFPHIRDAVFSDGLRLSATMKG